MLDYGKLNCMKRVLLQLFIHNPEIEYVIVIGRVKAILPERSYQTD